LHSFVLGKKKSVTASLLFKQSWSDDFEKRKSTRFRVFRDEAKEKVGEIFISSVLHALYLVGVDY
jgi:hypothetical protein